MNQKAEQLYEAMQQDMTQCRCKVLPWSVKLECLFTICTHYWAMLQSEIAGYKFENESEEITFFKVIKPKFISEILYCGFLSHALLFKDNVNDPNELEKFLRKESQRLKKFCRENFDFWIYYEKGITHLDPEWFTRKKSLKNMLLTGPYDKEEKACSGYDGLVSNLLALERYMAYLTDELKALHEKID